LGKVMVGNLREGMFIRERSDRTVSARGGVVFTRLVGRNWGYEVIGTWKIDGRTELQVTSFWSFEAM